MLHTYLVLFSVLLSSFCYGQSLPLLQLKYNATTWIFGTHEAVIETRLSPKLAIEGSFYKHYEKPYLNDFLNSEFLEGETFDLGMKYYTRSLTNEFYFVRLGFKFGERSGEPSNEHKHSSVFYDVKYKQRRTEKGVKLTVGMLLLRGIITIEPYLGVGVKWVDVVTEDIWINRFDLMTSTEVKEEFLREAGLSPTGQYTLPTIHVGCKIGLPFNFYRKY